MDTRTGEIATLSHFRARCTEEEISRFVREVEHDHLPRHTRRELARTGRGKLNRNDPCPCQSGRKFKACCMDRGSGLLA